MLRGVADVAFPDKKHAPCKMSLSKLPLIKNKEFSNKTEASLKMRAADFEWFPINNRRRRPPEWHDVFVIGIDMEFNVTAFMQLKETAAHADLYEEAEQMQQWRVFAYQHKVKQWRIAILITCDSLVRQENVCEAPHDDECCQMASELF
jgi:hypothetical protein